MTDKTTRQPAAKKRGPKPPPGEEHALSQKGKDAIAALPRPEPKRKGVKRYPGPKDVTARKAMFRAYLDWANAGFQTTGPYGLAKIANERGLSKQSVLLLCEHDPRFKDRIEEVLDTKHLVGQMLVIGEINERLMDETRMKSVPLREVAKVGEFLAKAAGGAFKTETKEPSEQQSKVRVEIDLNLAKPEGYDQPRRTEARVKASEELGNALLLGGGADDGDTDSSLGEGPGR